MPVDQECCEVHNLDHARDGAVHYWAYYADLSYDGYDSFPFDSARRCDNDGYPDDPIFISAFHRDILDEMRGHRCATNEQSSQRRTKDMAEGQSSILIASCQRSGT